MASIENRSVFIVTVQNRDDLTKTFACTREKALKAYLAQLSAEGFKPRLDRANNRYAVRIREAGRPTQCLYASSEEEALTMQLQLESERRRGLFVDYGKGRKVTFADLLARYLREESPRHKAFEVEGYIINAMLADAGLPRVDIAQAYAAHKNPHPSLKTMVFRKATGKSARLPFPAALFIRRPFADLLPEDINDYIDERCEAVSPATVDREVDIFSAVCHIAIDTWRIPVPKSPMDGVKRPRYFNERDRRLKGDEEARLLQAAYDEDAQQSIKRRLDDLMREARVTALQASTVYTHKKIVREALATYEEVAEQTYVHTPLMEAFIQFQLMTGARTSETLSLTWDTVDFAQQTAFIAESKNGRPRTLSIRKELVQLLQQLPRSGNKIFSFEGDQLRDGWKRVCKAANIDPKDLHIHDLRHEAISRVAEASRNLQGGFTVVDLQAFSGHRDLRMLSRYVHLCAPGLAKRLDMAFANTSNSSVHRGRRRLSSAAQVTLKEAANADVASGMTVTTPAPSAASNVIPFRRTGTL